MSEPIVVRSKVENKDDYKEYRSTLRDDFWYACAYCSITEIEAGGIDFHIDHYYPRSEFPEYTNEYNNLFWSCRICNSHKGAYYPENDLDKNNGKVIIRLDEEDPDDHYRLPDGNMRLEPLTQKGNYNIYKLNLNRKPLLDLRNIRYNIWKSNTIIQSGLRTLSKAKIDRANPKYRLDIIKMQKKCEEQHRLLSDSLEELIKTLSRSCLIDIDPDKETASERRRRYLEKQKSLLSYANH